MGLFGGLGLNFNKNKGKSSSQTDKTLSQTESGTRSTASAGTESVQQQQATQTAQQQQTATQQQQQQQSQQQTQQVTSQFDATSQEAIAALLQQVLETAGGANQANQIALQGAVDNQQAFDPAAFVAGLTGAADINLRQDAEQGINAFNSAIGGTAATNTTAALAADRISRDRETARAGIASGATAQAEQIQSQLLQTLLQAAQAGGTDAVAAIGNLLKGGTATTTGAAQTTAQQQLTGQESVAQTGQSATQATQESQNTQTALELLSQLLNQTSNEKTKGKTSGTSFGASFAG